MVIELEIMSRIFFVKSSRLEIVGEWDTFSHQEFQDSQRPPFLTFLKKAVKIVYIELKRPFHDPLNFVSQGS